MATWKHTGAESGRGDDGPRSVMAEWRLDSTSQEPSHVNLGDRPVLPADTFIAEVERLLG